MQSSRADDVRQAYIDDSYLVSEVGRRPPLASLEVARRGGIQQRQVSLFERGGDVTLSTLMKLAQALDLELLPVPREAAAKVESLLTTQRERPPSVPLSASPPSLLDRYRVNDDDEPSNA